METTVKILVHILPCSFCVLTRSSAPGIQGAHCLGISEYNLLFSIYWPSHTEIIIKTYPKQYPCPSSPGHLLHILQPTLGVLPVLASPALSSEASYSITLYYHWWFLLLL